MEEKLKRLFDLQKFQSNSRLTAMLADTENRYGAILSEDDLAQVSAAGNVGAIMVQLLDPFEENQV